MSMYTALKKYAKRKAGVWGRVNHKRDMRAASKALRVEGRAKSLAVMEYCEYHNMPYSNEEMAKQIFEDMQSYPIIDPDFDLITDEEPH